MNDRIREMLVDAIEEYVGDYLDDNFPLNPALIADVDDDGKIIRIIYGSRSCDHDVLVEDLSRHSMLNEYVTSPQDAIGLVDMFGDEIMARCDERIDEWMLGRK